MRVAAPDLEAIFDLVPDVVFFLKDREGRYVAVNRALVLRCGRREKHELVGLTPGDVFPAALAQSYAAQDRQVVETGQPILEQLELHLFPNRSPGWCITRKLPLRDGRRIVGLVGISRDLGRPNERDPVYPRLQRAVDHLHAHVAAGVSVAALARLADLSVSQLERQFQRVFQLAPRRLLVKFRVEHATRLLETERNIAAVAQACGYADHSAFTRQFRAVVGVTPRAYRRLLQEGFQTEKDLPGRRPASPRR